VLQSFKSLSTLVKAFPDEPTCIRHFRSLRWPKADEITCPWCGVVGAHYTLKDETHKCRDCLKKFSVRHGTIFGDSKVPLQKWFMAVYLCTAHKKGISSCQLARDIDVTQKTAWFMLHRIRNAAMTAEFNTPPLTGTVEVDECYVGPKPMYQHAEKRIGGTGGRSAKGKKVVFGMLQRDGDLRLAHVANVSHKTTIPLVVKNVARGANVHTDESSIYSWMASSYAHSLVTHSLGQYVKDGVTTNGIEGVFSHFRRTMIGTYHKSSYKHLDRYLQMFAFRWNNREVPQGDRMNDLLRATKGRRLTYKALVN
jgi:transposase-like protein